MFLEHLNDSYETKTPCFSHSAPTDQSVISKSRGEKKCLWQSHWSRDIEPVQLCVLEPCLSHESPDWQSPRHDQNDTRWANFLPHTGVWGSSGDRLCSAYHPSAAVVSGFNPLYKSDCFLVTFYAKRRFRFSIRSDAVHISAHYCEWSDRQCWR